MLSGVNGFWLRSILNPPQRKLIEQKKLNRRYEGKPAYRLSRNLYTGFDKLVQDGMARKFDAVVVDSIFRCGRTLPFAIEALQRTFYPLGIQFAVVDGLTMYGS